MREAHRGGMGSTLATQVVLFVVLVAVGLALESSRVLHCQRPTAEQVDCSSQLQFFGLSLPLATTPFVREAWIGEKSKTMQRSGTGPRKLETVYHPVLIVSGDGRLTDSRLELLGPVRAFLNQQDRRELHLTTTRDIRRTVGAWLALGLAALLLIGRALALFGGHEPAEHDDEAPLPDVPAWRPLLILALLAAGIAFFIGGHYLFGPRAVRQVDALRTAAEAGDSATLEALLDAGVDPNAPDRQHVVPLTLAARVGPAASVRALLDAGAWPDAASTEGLTALHRAVASGDPERVALLLDAGADVDASTDGGDTVLSTVAYDGNAALLDLLLRRGADPRAPLARGRTLLHAAATSGDIATVRRALTALPEIDPEIPDDEGATAWDLAGLTPAGSVEVRELLEQLVTPD